MNILSNNVLLDHACVAASPPASSDINKGGFNFSGYLNVEGGAGLDSSGLFKLTNTNIRLRGHIFYKNPIQFKNSTNATSLGSHGLAFVISPNNEISGALSGQYLGLFNATNTGIDSNHVVAIELEQSRTWSSVTDENHVGIDINRPKSVTSASAGYFTDEGELKNLSLKFKF
ncbi:hypothetical protein GOBAR_AA35830 [Gossypium barbadense]|uniref:Legume lectin domain-containing protein n=1 Tax=Gossypium barbadense TaxID=3634 RepID=A0A2P5QFT9_GOSBA|nr:hypothetical protein GOBAR_DD29655 [Gossypium barbadense]PPR84884.1 hypothetical protein GOBAR_AA35830 [Gossypium barbadense]